MATPAIRMLRRLEGLFCVYKPSGVHWKLIRDTVETNILKGEGDPLWQNDSIIRETYLLFSVHHNITQIGHCILLTYCVLVQI